MKNRGNVQRKQFRLTPLAIGLCTLFAAGTASAVNLTTPDGQWTFSINGNINADLVYTQCAEGGGPNGGLLCANKTASQPAGSGDRGTSSVNTGLLPTAIVFGVATTQEGYDLKAVFGFYPGITSHAGADPNGVAGLGTPIGLQTTQIDTRQAFVTVGNKSMGTFKAGRDFGLFGFDAIINDMTIPGVGVEGFMAPAPGNTSLGSIGYGYIYTDTLAQIDYTTPNVNGLEFTGGVYEPLNQVNLTGLSDATSSSKSTPGFHERIKYKFDTNGLKGFISSAGIAQRQTGLTSPTSANKSAFAWGLDVTGVVNAGPLSLMLSGYDARGLGTTALFYDGYDLRGEARRSWGYLAQATYKVMPKLKLGVNYGVSRLGKASGENDPTLVFENSKVTVGAYWSALPNLTLLTEVTRAFAKSQSHNNDIATNNFNVGAFFSF